MHSGRLRSEIARFIAAETGVDRNMFTGLIQEVGTVAEVQETDRGRQLQVIAPQITATLKMGESISVNGCCLTVVARQGDQMTFDLLKETLRRTNLESLRAKSRVNLERALTADGSIGGHFVQGHIDCRSRILNFEKEGTDHRLEIELPSEFAHYVISKGSIAVDGISLTVAEVLERSFAVWIIPHTKAQTNLETAHPGDMVNLEFDLIAKYVERMLDHHAGRT